LIAEDDRKKSEKGRPPLYHVLKMTPGTSGVLIDLYDYYDTYKVGGGYMY